MNRAELQQLSSTRRAEARVLLNAGHHAGAYYLLGYAVECALKACIAKNIKRYDFPDKKLANEAFTHDLTALVKVAGLGPDLDRHGKANAAFEVNWAIVKDWSEKTRYVTNITDAAARDLYSACTARRNGVLAWVRTKW